MRGRLKSFLACLLLVIVVAAPPAQAGSVAKDMKDGHWAEAAVKSLIGKGIIQNHPDGTFAGDKPMTRYAMAEMVSRTLNQMEKEHNKLATKADLDTLRDLLKELANEIVEVHREGMNTVEKQEQLCHEWAAFKAQQESQLAKMKQSLPLAMSGDMHYRYQLTKNEDQNGSHGSTRRNTNRFRLNLRYDMDPKTFANVRWVVGQPVMRDGDFAANTTLQMDLFFVSRQDMLGGDWTLGRQFGGIGNNLLMLNYYDGLNYQKKFGKGFRFEGILLAENDTPSPTKTHGHQANVLSLAYTSPKYRNHTVSVTRFEQNSDMDKFGVLGGFVPGAIIAKTKERWGSFDIKGEFGKNKKWDYMGTLAYYNNQLGGSQVSSQTQYLRGNTENAAAMVGLRYKPTTKLSVKGTWAQMQDNFRAFSVLSDLFYQETAYSPFEEAFNALALAAQNPATGNLEGVKPEPLSRPGERRSGGAYQADFHGYRDLQFNTEYMARDNLKLCLVGDWLKPAKGAYGYKDVTAVTGRIRYFYKKNQRFELRLMRVVSDYNRTVDDLRTEFYMNF